LAPLRKIGHLKNLAPLFWRSGSASVHGPASIVYLGGCQSSFGRKQLSFSTEIISYDSWGIRLHEGGSLHTFRLIRPDQSKYAISKRGPHYMGYRLFRDTGRAAAADNLWAPPPTFGDRRAAAADILSTRRRCDFRHRGNSAAYVRE